MVSSTDIVEIYNVISVGEQWKLASPQVKDKAFCFKTFFYVAVIFLLLCVKSGEYELLAS